MIIIYAVSDNSVRIFYASRRHDRWPTDWFKFKGPGTPTGPISVRLVCDVTRKADGDWTERRRHGEILVSYGWLFLCLHTCLSQENGTIFHYALLPCHIGLLATNIIIIMVIIERLEVWKICHNNLLILMHSILHTTDQNPSLTFLRASDERDISLLT